MVGPAWGQPIQPDDTPDSDRLQMASAQPVADVGSLCTVIMPMCPFSSLNWGKIPCEYPIFRAGIICERPAVGAFWYTNRLVRLFKYSACRVHCTWSGSQPLSVSTQVLFNIAFCDTSILNYLSYGFNRVQLCITKI